MNRKRRREWACALAICLVMAAVYVATVIVGAQSRNVLEQFSQWLRGLQ